MQKAVAFSMVLGVVACSAHNGFDYSGTLQAPSAAVGSTIGGRVSAVYVQEGDAVHRGQVLLRFDDKDQRAAVASAVARLAQARSVLADLRAGTRPEDLARAKALANQQLAEYHAATATQPYERTVSRNQSRQAFAQLANARAAAADANADAARMQQLYATGDVSAQQRDAAVARAKQANAEYSNRLSAVRAARAQERNTARVSLPQNAAAALAAYRAANEQYNSLAAGARPDQIRQAEAAVRTAQADVAQARARLAEMVISTPSDGTVTAMDLHPGDLIPPNASIATIEEPGNPYARIYVPQSKLGKLKLGSHLQVRSDSLAGATFDGKVEQIDERAEYTPQDVQTAGDRALLSFGIKVRIDDPQHRLHPGTTVSVDVP